MKLHATMIPYSGTAGGGLALIDEDGRGRFMIAILSRDIHKKPTKEQTAAIAGALINGIPDPIEVPDG